MSRLQHIRGATRVGSVYKITNLVTGKSYIGSSFNVENRVKAHFLPSTKRLSTGHTFLYEDMDKYGRDNFESEVLEDFTTKDAVADYPKLIEMEIKWTLHFNSHIDGYNWCLGDQVPEHRTGENHTLAGRTRPQDTIEKMRAAAMGRVQSESTRAKMSQSHTGTQASLETRAKMSAFWSSEKNPNIGRVTPIETVRKIAKAVAESKGGTVLDTPLAPDDVAAPHKSSATKKRKGRNPENRWSRDTAGEKNAFYGKQHSAETKAKIAQKWAERSPEEKEARRVAHSEKMKGMNAGSASFRAKKVRCVETGMVYGAISEAGIAIGAGKKNNISKALKTGCTCGGFHWEYAD